MSSDFEYLAGVVSKLKDLRDGADRRGYPTLSFLIELARLEASDELEAQTPSPARHDGASRTSNIRPLHRRDRATD